MNDDPTIVDGESSVVALRSALGIVTAVMFNGRHEGFCSCSHVLAIDAGLLVAFKVVASVDMISSAGRPAWRSVMVEDMATEATTCAGLPSAPLIGAFLGASLRHVGLESLLVDTEASSKQSDRESEDD
ncbi:hypothetical protein CABS01_00451 [Colletotrichum abscissum]|uniref:Uncharacterized protein n=1 Tax=Colletotrichum abscissum TaxID=1671311 RepID=A0A9Q0B6Y7_9PEZI|nr:uncharacterized protein CABS01_00451 [Colletotrichum abscissum]KAI3559365.1 hypothetical protein CABS02_00340 [Colletotrichum abscissum]KAK1525362.1 hypothetical protein CABS01_00451 [Colletotrichum abscissum]